MSGDGKNLVGLRMEGNKWVTFLDAPVGFPPESFVALPSVGATERLAINRMPFSFGIYSVGEDELILERRFGKSFPFPAPFFAFMFIPHLVNIMLPLILAFVLSSLMLRYRVTAHAYGGHTVAYASLIRRAIAQIIDGVFLFAGAIPFVVCFFKMFDMFEQISTPTMIPLYFIAFMAFSFGWSILLLLAFSFSEGRWGVTPGKWAVGIRVVGTDLQPCGFWRALLRNFLKVVDGFFNFMVGILIVTFTKEWQRVGDMAARTIVVRKMPAL
jgi:uncharacterized RDD family membrane protein YckC